MRAHNLLNLLNEVRKRDKMRGLCDLTRNKKLLKKRTNRENLNAACLLVGYIFIWI